MCLTFIIIAQGTPHACEPLRAINFKSFLRDRELISAFSFIGWIIIGRGVKFALYRAY